MRPPLSVMTYNVRYFGHATRGLASTKATLTKIAHAIASLDPLPDVIGLQEVETRSIRSLALSRGARDHEPQLDKLLQALDEELCRQDRPKRYAGHYFRAHRYRLTARTNLYTTGLALLTSDALRIDHHNAERPHDITHRRHVKRMKQTRICAHASLRCRDGGTIDIFNTHLSLPGVFYRAFWTEEPRMGFGPNQLAEAKALGAFVERERLSDRFVVLGDFNALPGSPVDRYFREELGWADALRQVGRVLGGAKEHPTAGFLNLRLPIDRLYSSPNVAWIDADASHPFDHRGPFRGLSDHVPLIARFALPK